MVAISPMMEDGTAYLASKRDLEFSVCSDFDNTIAKEFQITFTVQPHLRPFFQNWGENIPEFSGVDSWEIPLPATYVIAPDGRIAWSFIDNDPGIRGEVQDIIHQVATVAECTTNFREETQSACSSTTSAKKEKKRPLFNRTIGYTFKSVEFRKLWKSKRDSDEVQNGQNDREDTSRLSVRSDLSVEHIKRTPRRRGRTQSAKEFLGSYMLPS
jgi:peroxiredoxin